VVVTDDRSDIGSRIPISGVRWVSCAQFGDILWGRESGRKRNHGPEKPTTPRTKKAIDYWLDQFADEEM